MCVWTRMVQDRAAPPEELLPFDVHHRGNSLQLQFEADPLGQFGNQRWRWLLFILIINTHLSLFSRGSTSAFHFPRSENCYRWEEVLDITLLTEQQDLPGGEAECV